MMNRTQTNIFLNVTITCDSDRDKIEVKAFDACSLMLS
jgi:hypothetical protein